MRRSLHADIELLRLDIEEADGADPSPVCSDLLHRMDKAIESLQLVPVKNKKNLLYWVDVSYRFAGDIIIFIPIMCGVD